MPAVLLASFAVHAFVTDATDRRDAVSGAENPIGARLSSVKQLDYGRVAVHEPGNHPPTVATPAPVFTATTGSTGWSFLGPPPDGAGPPPVPTEPPTLPVDPAPEPVPEARVPAALAQSLIIILAGFTVLSAAEA